MWRTYYASTFNPARLKVSAMLKEMPRRYWKNMPEAALIGELIAGAQAWESSMIGAASQTPALPGSLAALAIEADVCARCAIGCNGTRTVFGEGPTDARIMLVGEQPGDVEEQECRVFAGPAGNCSTAPLRRRRSTEEPSLSPMRSSTSNSSAKENADCIRARRLPKLTIADGALIKNAQWYARWSW
jgi:uracil-DNA glycosylase